MSDKTKIALLCNNKMAMPALVRMAGEGVLCSIATTDKDPEVMHMFREKSVELNIPFCIILKQGHMAQLEQWVRGVQPDIVFVMTYPWRIPADILALPKMGFLNFHYGLLPEMRGADPVFESIRQRMADAGVTVHIMEDGLDTGPIVLREQTPLSPDFTYGILSSQLSWAGDRLCTQILSDLSTGKDIAKEPQDEARAKYWPKISAAELWIKWDTMDSKQIMALVRACNPIAKGAPTSLNGWTMGICDVSEVNLQGDTGTIKPGTIVCLDQQNGLIVYCKDGKGLKLDVIVSGEGILPGYKMAFFGIGMGMVFGNQDEGKGGLDL